MKVNSFKRFIAIILVIISILAISVPVLAETGIKAGTYTEVWQSEARFRSEPKKDSICLRTLSAGTKVKISKTTNSTHGWYTVIYDGMLGYIREDYLGNAGYDVKKYGGVNINYEEGDSVTGCLANIRKDLLKVPASQGGPSSLKANKFDAKWTKAIKDFQKKNGLKADGIIGRKTKKKLWTIVHGKYDPNNK